MFKELITLPCLWESLKTEPRPIFLYGTGNGADKILDVCIRYDIQIAGVFASSGFVRSRTFRDMPVRSIEAIREEFGEDFVVLLAFGTTLDSVIENINEIAKRHTLYIPEVPLYDSPLFDREFFISNYDSIVAASEIFSDEESKKLYYDMIRFRLSGEPKYLSRVMTPTSMYSSLINEVVVTKVIDCGAYKGDSASDIISSLHPKELHAFEPDPKTFIKLTDFANSVSECKVTTYNFAVGNDTSTVEFNSSGSRGSGAEGTNKRGKTTEVAIRSLDSFEFKDIDLIKYDVEGDEVAAINGSLKTITSCLSALSISVYHRSQDIFEIPLKIKQISPEYRFYLRRVPCIPAWDISFVAVPENKIKL